jgi:hypothetical protein
MCFHPYRWHGTCARKEMTKKQKGNIYIRTRIRQEDDDEGLSR